MHTVKRIIILSLFIILCIVLSSCGDRNDPVSEFETYANEMYTIAYPSDWPAPVVDEEVVTFSAEDQEILLYVTTSRIDPYRENYIEEALSRVEKEIAVAETPVGDHRGYKVTYESNDEMNTAFVVQEKDLFLEMNFISRAEDHEAYQPLIDRIKDTLTFQDFKTLTELNRSPIVHGDREERWLADLDFLSKKLPAYHKNLFFKVGEEEFTAHVERLRGRIPTLTEDELIVEMSRLIASVGDAHTNFLFATEERYPFAFYSFADGLYLVKTKPELNDLIGLELKSINGKSIEEIKVLFRSLISHENESWFEKEFAETIVVAAYLNGLGITAPGQATFTFSNDLGDEKSQLVKSIDSNELDLQNATENFQESALYRTNNQKNYWYAYREEEQLLYFQYNVCYDMEEQSFSDFNRELFAVVDNHPVEKLVVDMRNNQGGSALVLNPFFNELEKREDLNQRGKLFVAIGRETFSSAVQNTLRFDRETEAIFIGEPTGGKPNHYGEVRRLKLRNTHTEVSYSTAYFEPLPEDVDAFAPDVLVKETAEDYFLNVDPVMEKILSIQ